MAKSNQRPSVVIWRELITNDVEKVKRYYGELFGWKYKPTNMGTYTYTMIAQGETTFGGMMQMEKAPQHAHWLSYISCEDVDAAAKRAKSEGGTIAVEPREIPDVGRFAVIGDLDSAYFAIMAPSRRDAPPSETPGLGRFCWETLTTKDVERAKRFYGAVLGWQVVPGPGGNRDIPMFASGDKQVADVQIARGMPPSWVTYVVVQKIEDANTRVGKLGGTVVQPLIEVPNVGRISLMKDPTGAFLGLFEPAAR
jgi:predicted enzyme related to lactoylglutathione lyase